MFFRAPSGLAVILSPWGYRMVSVKVRKGNLSVESVVDPGLMAREVDLDFATTSGIPQEIMADIASTAAVVPKSTAVLILPDRSMRIINLKLAALPKDKAEAHSVISWRIKESHGIDLNEFYYHLFHSIQEEGVIVSVSLTPKVLVEPFKKYFNSRHFDFESTEPASAAAADYYAINNNWPDTPLLLLSFTEGSLLISQLISSGIALWRTIRLDGPNFAASQDNTKKLTMAWNHLKKSTDLSDYKLAVIGEGDYFSLNAHLLPEITGMQPLMISPGKSGQDSDFMASCLGSLSKVLL